MSAWGWLATGASAAVIAAPLALALGWPRLRRQLASGTTGCLTLLAVAALAVLLGVLLMLLANRTGA